MTAPNFTYCFIVAGPYRNPSRPDGHSIYEVALVTNGKYSSTLATCRTRRTGIARAKRERTMRKIPPTTPIYTRFPSEDPVLVKE